MKKKLTLEETWDECMKMWRWIVEQRDAGRNEYVSTLKAEYVRNMSLTHHKPGSEDMDMDNSLVADCWFCEYNEQNGGTNEDGHGHEWDEDESVWGAAGHCSQCPGTLVSKHFYCGRRRYHYSRSPRLFLNKLIELNEARS